MTPAERPILFSSAMVRAILDGNKSMTRRVVKPQLIDGPWPAKDSCLIWPDDRRFIETEKCPHGHVGDNLWVRETANFKLCDKKKEKVLHYRADGCELDDSQVWTPSIYMPRWASRITLEITGVRVERLASITVADCLAEGIQLNGRDTEEVRTAYRILWDSINAKRDGGIYAWDKSPWVWIIQFRKL